MESSLSVGQQTYYQIAELATSWAANLVTEDLEFTATIF